MECKHCEYANLIDNKCAIDGRMLYDECKPLIQECDNYEGGYYECKMNYDRILKTTQESRW